VRGLDYYDHTVFEVEAMVEGFGSQNVLGAGGRYNGLVEELDGPSVPGMGFAMGLGRLMLAIEKENIELPIDDSIDCFVMYVSDTEKDYATTLVQELRMNGYKVDTEYTGRGLKAQFKQADRLNSKFLIILNDEDLKNNEIKIKNNKTKKETTVELDYLMYFLDEELLTLEEESDDCDCGCGHHECSHDEECECGDECHCHDDIEF
jgi:histidyl-tRNA synthetase